MNYTHLKMGLQSIKIKVAKSVLKFTSGYLLRNDRPYILKVANEICWSDAETKFSNKQWGKIGRVIVSSNCNIINDYERKQY